MFQRWKKPLVKKVLLWTGSITAILLLGLALLAWKVLSPVFGILYFNQQRASVVCAEVLNGSLKPASSGIINLPVSDSGLSLENQIYTSTEPTGTVWILFRTWRGKGDNLHGYAYRSTPAVAPAPASINLLVPILRSSTTAPSTGRLDVDVLKQLSPNWYEVSFDLD